MLASLKIKSQKGCCHRDQGLVALTYGQQLPTGAEAHHHLRPQPGPVLRRRQLPTHRQQQPDPDSGPGSERAPLCHHDPGPGSSSSMAPSTA